MGTILTSDMSKGIGELLQAKRIRVPHYQRSYAWKKAQVRELYDDFRRAIDDDRDYYFLGSVVGCQNNPKSDEIEIVDGQQRIATAAILLAAIRDRLLLLSENDLASRFEQTYLFHEEGLRNPTSRSNMSLNDSDNNYFQHRVVHRAPHSGKRPDPLLSSHRLIDDAAKIAASLLKELIGTRSPSDEKGILDKWVEFISDKARVIFIVVEDSADAFMIFETLNDRGLDLTIADLTKNHLFMKCGQQHIDEAKACWSRMSGMLATTSDAEIAKVYIHHLWSSYNGVTRDKELFKAIRRKYDTSKKALDFTKQLEAKAAIYAALTNSDSEFWQHHGRHAKRHLAILNSSLKVTQIRMLLLAVVDEFTPNDTAVILSCCVSWSVRFLIAGGSPSTWESHYASRAKKIREKVITNAAQLIEDMASDIPADRPFRDAFATEDGVPRAVARYLLRCLESRSAGELFPQLAQDDPKECDLEHIMPQHPDPEMWPGLKRDEHEQLCERLGNYALFEPEENKKRQNGSFAAAKKVYARSKFGWTRGIASHRGDWGEVAIQARQEQMACLAVEIWPVRPTNAAKPRVKATTKPDKKVKAKVKAAIGRKVK